MSAPTLYGTMILITEIVSHQSCEAPFFARDRLASEVLPLLQHPDYPIRAAALHVLAQQSHFWDVPGPTDAHILHAFCQVIRTDTVACVRHGAAVAMAALWCGQASSSAPDADATTDPSDTDATRDLPDSDMGTDQAHTTGLVVATPPETSADQDMGVPHDDAEVLACLAHVRGQITDPTLHSVDLALLYLQMVATAVTVCGPTPWSSDQALFGHEATRYLHTTGDCVHDILQHLATVCTVLAPDQVAPCVEQVVRCLQVGRGGTHVGRRPR